MNHPDDDMLLMFLLETLNSADDSHVREHLSACQQCRMQQDKLQEELKRMSGIEMRVEEVSPPRLRRRNRLLALASRMAAVLLVGFLAGYMTAVHSNPIRPNPVQQRLIPNRLATIDSSFFPCQPVDISIHR